MMHIQMACRHGRIAGRRSCGMSRAAYESCWRRRFSSLRVCAEYMKKGSCRMDMCLVVSTLLALLLYLNTIPAHFAYDDSRAILKNPDVLSETPVWHILQNDFWGTPLTHSGSHKSYRPLTVLTFRLNYMLHAHAPAGYHLLNVLLHALATALFTHLARLLLTYTIPVLTAGLLFASHPIHTEAVAGVVGRADILACIHFLLALLSYIQYCQYRQQCVHKSMHSYCTRALHCYPPHQRISCSSPFFKSALMKKRLYLFLTGLFTVCSLLSKEHGVTVLAVCLVYDLFLHCRLPPSRQQLTRIIKPDLNDVREGIVSLVAMAALFVWLRVYFMGSKTPEFAPADNPASDCANVWTRTRTFLYLPVLNLYLLLFPYTLSFDWSMEAVPLLETLYDWRNLYTLVSYSTLLYTGAALYQGLNMHELQSDSQMDEPCYSSSTSQQHNSNHNNSNERNQLTHISPIQSNRDLISTQIQSHASVTRSRDSATQSRDSTAELIYKESISPVLPCRRRQLQYRVTEETESGVASAGMRHTCTPIAGDAARFNTLQILLISLCILILPFIPASNLFFYVGFVIAERVLYIPSMGFILLVAYGSYALMETACLRQKRLRECLIFAILALVVCAYSVRTVLRNEDWSTEEKLYRAGVHINPAKAWGNLANILNAQGKVSEAESAYKSALQYRPNMADVHYNLGILLQDQQRYEEAIESYQMAIQCRPKLTMAHLNMAIVKATLGKKEDAEAIYRHCAEIDTSGLKDPRLHENTKISALYNLGRLLAEQERYQEAIGVYKKAINRRPSHYAPQSLYNMLGEAYSKLDMLSDAEIWYREALRAKSNHIPAHLTMAKLMQKRGKMEEAENWFLKAKELDSSDSSVYQHYGQFLGDAGRHIEAADSYARAATLSPVDFELVFNAAVQPSYNSLPLQHYALLVA